MDPETSVVLVNIDNQRTFHEGGELPVDGATADTRRTIAWIEANAQKLGAIVSSLDSHEPGHIGFGEYWVNARGEHPQPFTRISLIQYYAGVWRTADPQKQESAGNYLFQLEGQGGHHTIWPHHALIGTPGHDMVPELKATIDQVVFDYGVRDVTIWKGFINDTEHYSMFEPDVKLPGIPEAQLNTDLLEYLSRFRLIYVGGQAKSHCVVKSAMSMATYYRAHKPGVLPRIVMLEDCMSAINDPDAIRSMNASFALLRRLGVRFASSTDPIS